MGNAARKARKREGIAFEKSAKTSTSRYLTRQERDERNRATRRSEETALRVALAVADTYRARA